MYGALCAPGVSKHHCFDEHDELHFALARERRWHGSACRTVTHRPDCRGADEKMRLNSSVVLLDHQRSGDGLAADRQTAIESQVRDVSNMERRFANCQKASPLRRLASSVTDWLTPAALSFHGS